MKVWCFYKRNLILCKKKRNKGHNKTTSLGPNRYIENTIQKDKHFKKF